MRTVNTWLQEAVELAVENISHRLDAEQGDRPWFWFDLEADPPCLRHDYWDFCDMAGRWTNAVMLVRQMTGFEKPGLEERLKNYMLARQGRDGLFYNEPGDSKAFIVIGEVPDGRFADMFCQAKVLVALVTWHLETGSADVEERIERQLGRLVEIMPWDGDACRAPALRYLQAGGWQEGPGGRPDIAAGFAANIAPTAMRYAEATGSKTALKLARGLVNGFVLTEGSARGDSIYFRADGRFVGNGAWGGGLPAMAAGARFARVTGDDRLLDLCRRAFENFISFATDFGWMPTDVNTPKDGEANGQSEICNVTDAFHAALQLMAGGVGDYWDFIDSTARNQVLEQQFRDPMRLFTEDQVRRADQPIDEALRGSVESWATPNSLVGNASGLEGCCTGALVRSLYFAWESAVEERAGRVWIHMPFTRSHPGLEMLCHEPWEGAITLEIKKPCNVSFRLPKWVEKDTLKVVRNDAAAPAAFDGRHLLLDGLARGDTVRLAYPIPETQRDYRIDGRDYTAHWRGGTLVEMSPPGRPYPIYRREDRLEKSEPISEFPSPAPPP
jgi:hypothetical protein